MELEAEGGLDEDPDQHAARERFDREIEQAAAGDFEGLGLSAAPLEVTPTADEGFVPTTTQDFLNFTT